jgi:proteasome accessory factor C
MSGPRNAEDRLRRLLVMLPWLMEMGEVPLAEVARRFDMTEPQVQSDLELVAMCGLPPFVDEMVDVFVDDGIVYVGIPRLFTRPLRLTAPEAFSLLTSARAAMELPGADPGARWVEDSASLPPYSPTQGSSHRHRSTTPPASWSTSPDRN